MPPVRSDQRPFAYPAQLAQAEAEQIHLRRSQAGIESSAPTVGVALSGGGIRSATFCLGFVQGLARLGLDRRIDFLSTVSGGGYFGSFLGAAYNRKGASPDKIQSQLRDNQSWPVQWLRDNGRFLAPNGAGDSWGAASVIIRNWVALHCVILVFAFFGLGFGVLVRSALNTALSSTGLWMDFERAMWSHKMLGLWWSPWTALCLIPLVLVMLPAGVAYWLTQSDSLVRSFHRLCDRMHLKIAGFSDRELVSHLQNRLTRGFTLGLVTTSALFAYAAVDTLGQTAYWQWSLHDFGFPTLWALLTGTGAALFGFGSKIYIFVENLLGKGKLKITFDALALAASLVWALAIIVGVSVAACYVAWAGGHVAEDGQLLALAPTWLLGLAVGTAFALSWIFSRNFGFVNLSSLQQVYAARLRRAYIGATNPQRQQAENFNMTEPMEGDDLSLEDYRPQKNGGPLHLINVTVNETISSKSHIERRDRKGLAMAVGPCGISVGRFSHNLWTQPTGTTKTSAMARIATFFENPTRTTAPVMLPTGEAAPATPTAPMQVEALTLGRWIAISGAAFTTGLGSRTNLGLSLLLGLANVRLGYWWNSGRRRRHNPKDATPDTLTSQTSRLFHRLLPVQTCLLNEFLARFHGTARRHWYLSDGGHFENTACYELVRRRVPFIVCVDAGADPQYQFDDLANLVRKARIDFGAEIEVVRRADQSGLAEPGHDLPSLEQIVHPALLGCFGSPEDFQALTEENPSAPANTRHVMLARIRYSDTRETCWLLLIKPGLGGDEPVDVLQYQRTHPLFPQEPTSDQFFDEAQWESYRKLGQHIASCVFSAPDDRNPLWSPSRFEAPHLRLADGHAEPTVSTSTPPVENTAVSPA